MEEVDVDDGSVRLADAGEGNRRRKRSKKKGVPPLQRQRSESEIREDLGLPELGGVSRGLGVVAAVFASMAAIGGAMQVMSSSNNQTLASQVQSQQKLDVSVTWEVFIAACETTWMATKLWTRLLWAILLPTSHQTFRITKDGFSAMQPSVRASVQFLIDLHWTTKLAVLGAIMAIGTAWMLEREIRRRRYRERLAAWVQRRNAAVHAVYDGFAGSVRKQSRILADALPHLFFAAGAGAMYVLGREQFAEFSRGIGGWAVVIGLPVLLATRALIVYDMAYRKKIERYHGRRRRTFSQLPTPEMAQRQEFRLTSYLASWIPGDWTGGAHHRNRHSTRRSARRAPSTGGDLDSEDDTSSIGSLDSQDISTVDGIHYPRQLEMDPDASLEQYEELQSVIYWVQYWTVLGVALLFEQMPLTGHLLSALPLWPPARLLWSLWLQMPGTSGAQLAFRFVVPLVDRMLGKVDAPTVSADQQNLLVNVLLAFRIISLDTRNKLAEVMETGSTLVIAGLVLFVMPSTITALGAIAIGIGRPVLSASRALIAIERAEKITRTAATTQDAASIKRFRSNSISITNGAVQTTQWLEYWVVYTVCMLVHGLLSMVLFWFPLWNHMLLAFTLWLQLPYFRGAHNIFKLALNVFYKVRPYFVKDESAPTERLSVARPPPVSLGPTASAEGLARIEEDGAEDASEQSSSRRSTRPLSSRSSRSSRSSGSRESPLSQASAMSSGGGESKRRSSRRSSRNSARSSRSSRSRRSERGEAVAKEEKEQSWLGWLFGSRPQEADATAAVEPPANDHDLDPVDEVYGDANDYNKRAQRVSVRDDVSSLVASDLGDLDLEPSDDESKLAHLDAGDDDEYDEYEDDGVAQRTSFRSQSSMGSEGSGGRSRKSTQRRKSRGSTKKKRRSSGRHSSYDGEGNASGADLGGEDASGADRGFFSAWWQFK